MTLDHNAIRKAYPNVITIDDSRGAFDKDGNKIDLVQSAIDSARTTLNAEYAAVKYKDDRKAAYPEIGDQLDNIYKAIDADSDLKTKFAAFHAAIKTVKDAHPKP